MCARAGASHDLRALHTSRHLFTPPPLVQTSARLSRFRPMPRLASALGARTVAVCGGYIDCNRQKPGRDEVSLMAAKDRIGNVGGAARAAQRSRYVQRLLED